ncbi:hypothetical protein [Gilliamella sp. Nev3-1]|uniref:hypothetical protein n=1 Tax=Gilliamella sp. Nev3-1 TaxID=3120250 RepID=UPI00080DD3AD|nr:hypothetical protein [Gilliamella apicola]OCG56973.1 hypothetical protein A9G40_00730 [Gilliamella apicola]
MTSKKIIEKLQQLDWYVKCETEHEIALVLNACLDANVCWASGEFAHHFSDVLLQKTPIFIGRDSEYDEHGLSWDDWDSFLSNKNCEDITNWFFEELRNE